MFKLWHTTRTILIDIVGVLLIIAAGLLGWLPGPGGIPLLLAGLGLLAINHAWARRLLRKVKTRGMRLAETVFADHPALKIAYDVVTGLLVVAAVLLLTKTSGSLLKSLGIVSACVALGIFLGNRQRLQRLVQHFKRPDRA